jgi:hypothetical protein
VVVAPHCLERVNDFALGDVHAGGVGCPWWWLPAVVQNLPLDRVPDDRGRFRIWGMRNVPRWRVAAANGR